MKPKFLLGLALILSVSCAQQAHALSTVTQIKTNTLQSVLSFIKIKTQDTERGKRRFRVIVTPYAGIKRENVFGTLEVYQGGRLVVRCDVYSARLTANDKEVDKSVRGKSMVFEFTIARDYLTNSKFDVNLFDPTGPAFADYWFQLKDFADEK